MEYSAITWAQLHDDVHELAQLIKNADYQADLIVTIARGGLTISHILSDFIQMPITSLTISTYNDMKQNRTAVVSWGIEGNLADKKILLVDDVSDTGKTFTHALDYLKARSPAQIKTAALYTKPWTEFTPDFSVKVFDKWIIYPYDVRETVESLSRIWLTEGVNHEEIKKRLSSLGIGDPFIHEYLE